MAQDDLQERLGEYLQQEADRVMADPQLDDPDLEPRRVVTEVVAAGSRVSEAIEERARSGKLDERALKVAYSRKQAADEQGEREVSELLAKLIPRMAAAIERNREPGSHRLARKLLRSLNEEGLSWREIRGEMRECFERGGERVEGEAFVLASGQPLSTSEGAKECTRAEFVSGVESLLEEVRANEPTEEDLASLGRVERERALSRRRLVLEQLQSLLDVARAMEGVL